MSKNVYQYVTDRIIDQLEKGNIPWRKPWKGQKAINYITRKEYKGINTLLLPYPGEYLTFKQCKDLGGTVKKGEKSHMIVFYQFVTKENKEGKETSYPLLKYYNVFHISQTEGIETKLEEYKTEGENNIIDNAEKVINDYIKKEKIQLEKVLGSDRAYYSPLNDAIVLPDIKQFTNSHEYYSTAFHESIHSTGHKNRLDRFTNQKSHSFGSKDYSKEELIAEIGSAMICNDIGIEIAETFENSVAYIQSWLKVLKDDVRFITTASSAAQKAVDYVLNTDVTI